MRGDEPMLSQGERGLSGDEPMIGGPLAKLRRILHEQLTEEEYQRLYLGKWEGYVPEDKIYVLAPSYPVFRRFLHRIGHRLSKAKYITIPEHIYGLRNITIYALEYWYRGWPPHHYDDLLYYARTHDITIKYIHENRNRIETR